jgi:hypothetical protein
MSHWFEPLLYETDVDEASLVGSGESLLSGSRVSGWRAPAADVVGKLCTGAERWQAAIRRYQAPVNLADILRARALI